MTLKRVPLADFRRFLKDTLQINNVAVTFYNFKNSVNQLHSTYPTPNDWLAVDPIQRLSFRYSGRSELWYIIFWSWHSGYCEGENQKAIFRRTDMIKYLSSRGKVNLSNLPVKLGLLSNAEAEFIRNKDVSNKGILNKLAIHIISVMKPLKQFTETDIVLADIMRPNDKRYNGKILRDIRYELGYSNLPGKRRQKTYFDECCAHASWGGIAREYLQHLKSSGALDYYVRKSGVALHKFYEWLCRRGEANASLLEYVDYLVNKFLV